MVDSDAEAGAPLLPCASQLPLTLEGIRLYAVDPFWCRIRTAILLTLFVLWVAMFAAAAVEAATVPSCNARVKREALDGLVYRVEAGGFYDGSGSGKGDLRGLITKLDYVAELGVKIIWLSPIYKSSKKNFIYATEDFREVDQDFGSLEIFRELVLEMKKRDLKLVIDLVPNHTSDKHVWFQKSIARIEHYADYYIWEAPSKFDKEGKPVPPNNWISTSGGSAWKYNEERKEYYLHQFTSELPDLNFRSGKVLQEMLNILHFWLDLGIDGFCLDKIPYLIEDNELRDEPLKYNEVRTKASTASYDSLYHIYTHGLPEDMEILQTFRNFVEEYSKESDGVPRIIMTGVYDSIENTMKYYGNSSKPLVDLLFNFYLITELNSSSSAYDVMNTISMWLNHMPNGMTANWLIGYDDQKRVASRLGPEMVDAMNMISLLLPGIAVTYYGEEIGMEEDLISGNDTFIPNYSINGQSAHSENLRSSATTLMQWNKSKNAGFSSSNVTWLPVNINYLSVNVEDQKDGRSHLNVYKQLSKARDTPAIKFGHLEMKVLNSSVFAFTRHVPGFHIYLVAVNWSEDHVHVDFGLFENVSDRATIYVQSSNSSRTDASVKDVKAVLMEPKEALVLIFEPPKS